MHSNDPARNLSQVLSFAAGFSSLPFDDAAADEYGQIRAALAAAGTPIGPNELMIAAIAVANGLTLETHNTAEFRRVPKLLIEDWEA
jgi:tRNA(fMet)-specific endonuclease VapC